ncbi:5068_t:CDS:2 [Funneliformis caledonium]|uniref:5068_t:CDS:1 n=1 Tax=Funneliformis caledonium TaxID=1117310 RepID=A0A9N9D9J2_9GLOM|nr:5068_t:CDS:2 [Funneliformis caledonium]
MTTIIMCLNVLRKDRVKSVYDELMPTEASVLYEYGFRNCVSMGDRNILFDLYIGLIKNLGCKASKIHSWWENGQLPQNVKKSYDEADEFNEAYVSATVVDLLERKCGCRLLAERKSELVDTSK